jgi:hypothetical protein
MNEPKLDVTRVLSDLVGRRDVLGKAGAVSLGAVLAALSLPDTAAAFASVPPPSSFSTLLGLCTPGSGTTSYTPGITNTLQAVHVTDSITFLACAVAQNKIVTGLTESLDTLSSCSQKTDASGTGTISYRNGQMSTWTLDSWTATRLLGQYIGVNSGLIANGPFNGARVWVFNIRAISDPSTCASFSGITGSTGTTTLIIAQ